MRIVRISIIALTCTALNAAVAPAPKQVKSFEEFARGRSAREAFKELINQETPVIVKFFLPGCQPCKSTEAEFEDLAKEYKDVAHFVALDTTKNTLSQTYKVHAVPTFIMFKSGKKIVDFKRNGLHKDGFVSTIKKELKRLNVAPIAAAPAA